MSNHFDTFMAIVGQDSERSDQELNKYLETKDRTTKSDANAIEWPSKVEEPFNNRINK